MSVRRVSAGLVLGIIVVSAFAVVAQRTPTKGVRADDWPSYRGNPAGTGYSTLSEIDRRTVGRLRRSWTFALSAQAGTTAGRGGAPQAVNSQATPIVIEGTMYLPTADAVVALDGESGREIANGRHLWLKTDDSPHSILAGYLAAE